MLSRHACLPSSSSSARFIFSKQSSLFNKLPRHLPKHNSITLPPYRTAADLANKAPYSDLGLRSLRPPDSSPDPRQETPPEVPDQEWEIRTGGRLLIIGHLT